MLIIEFTWDGLSMLDDHHGEVQTQTQDYMAIHLYVVIAIYIHFPESSHKYSYLRVA